MEKYNAYSVDDFLDDDDFIRYVKFLHPEDVGVWEGWLAGAPANRAAYDEAYASLVAMLSVVRIQPSFEEARLSWDVVGSRIDALDRRRRGWYIGRLSAAAVLVLAMLVSALYWYYNDKVIISTAYGQQQRVVLPDNSTVLLNANSSLTWYRAWGWRHGREVWLHGEGLFDVSAAAGQGFTAHAGEVDVAVLGTRFTIRERRNTVLVSLLSGKISVVDHRRAGLPLILNPGDAVNIDDCMARVSRIGRLTNAPQAWTDHKILANGMTVAEIIANYEDTYGYHIVLGNPAQATKKIDGTLSLESQEGVIYSLANILNAYIHREGDTIYLRPK